MSDVLAAPPNRLGLSLLAAGAPNEKDGLEPSLVVVEAPNPPKAGLALLEVFLVPELEKENAGVPPFCAVEPELLVPKLNAPFAAPLDEEPPKLNPGVLFDAFPGCDPVSPELFVEPCLFWPNELLVPNILAIQNDG